MLWKLREKKKVMTSIIPTTSSFVLFQNNNKNITFLLLCEECRVMYVQKYINIHTISYYNAFS